MRAVQAVLQAIFYWFYLIVWYFIACKFVLYTVYRVETEKCQEYQVDYQEMGKFWSWHPMVNADQIVTGAADRLPDVGGK